MNHFLVNVIKSVQSNFNRFDNLAYKFVNVQPKPNPIFIIGAPRTGSTLLFQIIVEKFKVTYISNLMALFPVFMIKIAKRSKTRILREKNVKESDLGYIKGIHSPNEAGAINRKWFEGIKSEKEQSLIKATISAITEIIGSPFISKNLLNSTPDRLDNIVKIFPNAKYIFLTREPLFTAQSLLLARLKSYGNYEEWWSTKPVNYESILKKSPEYQVLWQISEIEKGIKACINKYNLDVIKISYEDLCLKTQDTLQKLSNGLGLEPKDNISKINKVNYKHRINVNEEMWFNLNQELKQFNF